MLEVLVVCGDDGKGAFADETFQNSFGNSSADSRLCSSAEFINEQ